MVNFFLTGFFDDGTSSSLMLASILSRSWRDNLLCDFIGWTCTTKWLGLVIFCFSFVLESGWKLFDFDSASILFGFDVTTFFRIPFQSCFPTERFVLEPSDVDGTSLIFIVSRSLCDTAMFHSFHGKRTSLYFSTLSRANEIFRISYRRFSLELSTKWFGFVLTSYRVLLIKITLVSSMVLCPGSTFVFLSYLHLLIQVRSNY